MIALALLFLQFYTRHGHYVVVPRLEGLQLEQAGKILSAQGLQVEVIDSIYDKDAVPGSIIDQTPKADNRVKEGRSIYVSMYSKSPQMVALPSLEDYSIRQAVALLNSIGFDNLTIEEVPSEFSGLVMKVESRGRRILENEQVPLGTPLTLFVSSNELVDSTRVDNEIIVSPGDNLPSETTSNTVPQSSSEGFDDTFF